MKNNKGLSTIIATVLIVLLTIAAASILFVFVVPWIRDMLDCAKIKNDLQDKIVIEQSMYTCYNNTDSTTRIMISKKESKELDIIGYRVLLTASGTGKSYEIRNGTDGTIIKVKMYDDNTLLRVPPSLGGSETYVFQDIKAESAEVMPLLANGKTCGDSVKEKINNCNLV